MSTLEFEVRSGGTITIDLEKCRSCETKACVKICNTIGMGQIEGRSAGSETHARRGEARGLH